MTRMLTIIALCCMSIPCGCTAPPSGPLTATQIAADTPRAAFDCVRGLLADGRFETYYDLMLSETSKTALSQRHAELRKLIKRLPTQSEFHPAVAELEAAGMRADEIVRMDARRFGIGYLAIRYRRPGGAAAKPRMVAIDSRIDGDRASVRYRVGADSPIGGLMFFVNEGGLWKVEDMEAISSSPTSRPGQKQ